MIEKRGIKKIIKEVLDEANNNLSNGVHATILFEDIEWSVQDRAEIAVEMLLRNDYKMPRSLAEDISVNVVRKILPLLKP
jgi:hypothetical protein